MERPAASRIQPFPSPRRARRGPAGRVDRVRRSGVGAEILAQAPSRGARPVPAPAAIRLQAARLRIRSLVRDNSRLRDELARLGETVAQVEHLAYRDALTGLPNRSLLMDRLNQAMAGAQRESYRVAVLLIDLDRFKEVNDRLGHAAGDRLLREVAGRFTGAVRRVDTVARYGGDEFVVMLPRVEDLRSAQRVVRALRASLAVPFCIDGNPVEIDASVGLALFPEDGSTSVDLLALADARMYRHKARHAGRDAAEDPSLREATPAEASAG